MILIKKLLGRYQFEVFTLSAQTAAHACRHCKPKLKVVPNWRDHTRLDIRMQNAETLKLGQAYVQICPTHARTSSYMNPCTITDREFACKFICRKYGREDLTYTEDNEYNSL